MLVAIGLFVVIGFLFILASADSTLAGLVQGFILVSILIVLLNNAGFLQKAETAAFSKVGGAA